MDIPLATRAIHAALTYDWTTAIKLNKESLKEKSDNIDAMNRLAYAYTKSGKYDDARKLYRKILSIDKYNIIAQKNFDKLNSLGKLSKKDAEKIANVPPLSPAQFLEEPGKTKTVILINVAPPSVLSKLTVGSEVLLIPKRHTMEVRDMDKTFLGALPDDLSFRLLRFLKSGNSYTAYIKNTTKKSISVFLRETKRGKRFAMQPSFLSPSEKNPIFQFEKGSPEEEGEAESRPPGADDDEV